MLPDRLRGQQVFVIADRTALKLVNGPVVELNVEREAVVADAVNEGGTARRHLHAGMWQ
jgi:hypothetical protein